MMLMIVLMRTSDHTSDAELMILMPSEPNGPKVA